MVKIKKAVDDSLFGRFWAVYPPRLGSNPKAPAEMKFLRAVAAGIDPEMLIGSAKAYAAAIKATKQENTPYVAQAVTWLNQQRWQDYKPAENKTEDYDAIAARNGYRWDDLQAKYVKLISPL